MTSLTTYETKHTLRRDRAAWQKAAVGLLGLAVAGNTLLGGLYAAQRRETERWEAEYHRAEATKQAALMKRWQPRSIFTHIWILLGRKNVGLSKKLDSKLRGGTPAQRPHG